MRINKYVALSIGMSRRAADKAIADKRVRLNGRLAQLGEEVTGSVTVTLDGQRLALPAVSLTVRLNKPGGYVCSRTGQGSRTIYDLLPKEMHHLKPVGRLDKDSTGLLLLTNDGKLAHELTHPSFQKQKVYEAELDKPLTADSKTAINAGVNLEDGISSLQITVASKQSEPKTVNRKLSTVNYRIAMTEGRNRQIRRTFEKLGYSVVKLHRTHFGPYGLGKLLPGQHAMVE